MMIKHYKIVLFLTLASLFLGTGDSLGETKSIILQTYYPPPQAAYDLIRLFPRTDASNIPPNPCSDFGIGSMYMNEGNNSIYFCKPDETWGALSGIWMQGDTNTDENPEIFLADNQTGIDRDSPSDGPDINEIKVGFGTETPLFRLHLEGDGGILAAGSHLQLAVSGGLPTGSLVNPQPSGISLSTNGAGTRFFWYPLKAAIRAGEVTGTQWNNTNIGTLSVAFGHNTTAAGLGAMVHGGEANTVASTSIFSAILGGNGNTVENMAVQSNYSTIVGGQGNKITTDDSFIGGGSGNSIRRNDEKMYQYWNSGIGGGVGNEINTKYSAILGGANNIIPRNVSTPAIPSSLSDAPYSFIGGGQNNRIDWAGYNIVFGGFQNFLDGGYSAIGGGRDNIMGSWYGNVIMGGEHNCLGRPSINSSIGGGENNMMDVLTCNSQPTTIDACPCQEDDDEKPGSVIGGGSGNKILGIGHPAYSGIVGGKDNQLTTTGSADYMFIGGGLNNRVTNSWGTIAGGSTNTASGEYSFVGGGKNNQATGDYSVVPGGENNIAGGNYSLAAGKNMQITSSGTGTFAWGNSGTAVAISQANSFIIFPNAEGRVGIGTNAPEERVHIVSASAVGLRIRQGQVIIRADDQDPTKSPKDLKISQYIIVRQQDLAETFETSEDVEPGDILTLDPQSPGKLNRSTLPYDRKIVGVVSASPAILFEGSRMQVSPKPLEFTKGTRPPVALKGKVMVKVSLENGPIQVGDVLTSSPTPGHAMKSTDALKENGAIIGKALAPFKGGPKGETVGLIPVFIALH